MELSWFSIFLISLLLLYFSHAYFNMENKTEQPTENIYGFKANIISGTDDPVPFDFSLLKGKVVLIINVASNCGFTKQ